jgi:hypothetical protein
METDVNRIVRPLIFVLAAIYFLVDAIFMMVAAPVANWMAERWKLAGFRAWIASLSPYATLALFAAPLIVLEPVKPVAAYLAGVGHIKLGLAVLIVGEVLKLVLVERLFRVSRDKLMSIPAFARGYGKYRQALDWLESFEVWQSARRRARLVQYALRSYVRKAQASLKQGCFLLQPH